jgi:YbbR domain-containing protein
MASRQIWQTTKDFVFSRANREFLVFLFFLALSGIFWLLLTLNETYEKEYAVPVAITNIPKNAVLTSEETDTVKVTIRDKGYTLMTYLYGDIINKLNMNFHNYSHNNGTGIVTSQDIQKQLYLQLASGSRITSVKPEKLEFFYNYGAKKKVPVRWSGRVIPEELYFISRVTFSPDSVLIYASDQKLDSINMVYTEQLNYANFRDTLRVACELSKIKGVKMVPDKVNVSFFTDVLTEEYIEGIPVKGINMPEGKVLRTFPAKVKVSFVTGVNVYRNLKREDFTVVADYRDIEKNPTEKCRLYLKEVPSGISRAHLATNYVDYLIEEAHQE